MSRHIGAAALLSLASIAYAKTSEEGRCSDPLKCFSFENPITPQNVYKLLSYERTIDGDTFVANGKTIRLWGIDAPETGDPVFLASKMYMEVILESANDLRCKFIDMDRYSREVMHCQADGLDIGSMMVQMGMARDSRPLSAHVRPYCKKYLRKQGTLSNS